MAASPPLCIYLIFHLSTRCNLECSYCNVDAGPRGRRPVLNLAVFEKWVESFAALGPAEMAIQLHGGEPLIADPPVELYAAVARNSLEKFPQTRLGEIAVQSNGLTLTERRIDSLTDAGLRVHVSIDGPAAVHDRQRQSATGRSSHREAVRAHHRLRRRGKNAAALAVVCDPYDVMPTLEFFIEDGFREARINPMRPEGRGADTRDWSEASFMQEMAEQYLHAAKRIAEHNLRSPQSRFVEDNLARLMESLVEADCAPDGFHWTFLIDDVGDLWAHPAGHGVESLRLLRNQLPDAESLRQVLAPGAGQASCGTALVPALEQLRSDLFEPCAGCQSPDFCIAYQGPKKGADSMSPVCTWRTQLTGRLRQWLRESPDEARRILRAAPAAEAS